MANPNRRAGTIFFKIDGVRQDAKGNFTYNIGRKKREAMVGADDIHGFKEVSQAPFIEGEITDRADLDLEALLDLEDTTVTLELANGKTVILQNAWYAGDGNVGTEEANIQIRFEGMTGQED